MKMKEQLHEAIKIGVVLTPVPPGMVQVSTINSSLAASTCASICEKDMVRFAEWTATNGYHYCNTGKWEKDMYRVEALTTEPLKMYQHENQ